MSYSYNAAKEKVILYANGETMRYLLFDLNKDYAEDQNGNMYFQKPLVRNGVIFLPVSLIAQSFGLIYSTIAVERGYLVWVRTQSADMSERIFADAAIYPMETRYNQYLKSQETGQPEDETTESTGTPSESGQRVYLCIRADDAETVSELLDALDWYDSQAAFYCTVDFLEQEGDLLRRMTATGQAIGILADAAEEGRTVAEQLAAGNAALEAATCGKTRLARLENVSDQTAADVEAMGYCCLWPDMDRSPYPLADSSSADVPAAPGGRPLRGRVRLAGRRYHRRRAAGLSVGAPQRRRPLPGHDRDRLSRRGIHRIFNTIREKRYNER